ncbi:MAG: ORF6N domain-containing protein [Campylobacterales bacterium]|nr:ORF6N domain-containing protein [Campylobacterales bacterium]
MELTIGEINNKIFEIRGQKVILDRNLAVFTEWRQGF